ncbi:MAG: protealysin inhibitor emfourin [Verrucomicrobiota bacterium]
MRLTLTRSGGFAGLIRPPMTLDTSTLSAADARKIESLLESGRFFQLPSVLAAPAQPDRFQFTLTAEQPDGTKHSVTFGEQAAGKELQEVIRRIQGAA